MRVFPVSVCNYNSRNISDIRLKHKLIDQNSTDSTKEPVNFKGWKAGLGSVLGTLGGIGLGTILSIGTIGLAAPLILGSVGSAAGGIGTSIKESNSESNDADDFACEHDGSKAGFDDFYHT